MSTVRIAERPRSNFYFLDKRISEDTNLSWDARGMLIFLLGKPDHWEICIQALVNATQGSSRASGKFAVYAILKELIEAGYITRQKQYTGEMNYLVYEFASKTHALPTKKPKTENCDQANESAEKPNRNNPDLGNPDLGNQPLVSTDKAVKIEKAVSIDIAPAEKQPAKNTKTKKSARKTRIPADFAVSANVKAWAAEKGITRLDERLEHFVGAAQAKGYEYIDWDAAFMNACRQDWARLGNAVAATSPGLFDVDRFAHLGRDGRITAMNAEKAKRELFPNGYQS